MQTAIDTTNWVRYPFSVDGIDFVSLIDPRGSFYSRIEALTPEIRDAFNQGAVREFIGSPANYSLDELKSELESINAGYSQALIVLA